MELIDEFLTPKIPGYVPRVENVYTTTNIDNCQMPDQIQFGETVASVALAGQSGVLALSFI